ncbi:hypothetical protein DASB73_038630 [Starmerella bacillaris]|uniref:Uncharacterized protein n=1 Tax=Starmerella bacillaris TaxID=1247836 RepID=A0AAV5RMZ2_STABA|nr:hypothetical protein DASB73_038630 [Starmerella bacillaris]
MDTGGIEVGLLEKRVKKPRSLQILVILATVFHTALCLVLLILYEKLRDLSTRGTAAIIGAAMGGLGECLLQLYTKKYSFSDILRFQVWGVLNGIWTRCWTEKLIFHLKQKPLMILVDQLFGNPLSIFFFIGLTAFWKGYDIDLYIQKNYLPALKLSLIIWPIASTLQFTVIPRNFILIFNIVVSFIWVIVLGVFTSQ